MTLTKQSIYDNATLDSIIERIDNLSNESGALWGKMNVAQMLAHCADVQEVLLGKPLEGSPWYFKLLGPVVKKVILNSKPFPRDTATHPQYIVSDSREFEAEKARLLEALAKFSSLSPAEHDQITHPLFGNMTVEDKGWMSYKHLDHHLNQFGV